jgi:hypothetical protein
MTRYGGRFIPGIRQIPERPTRKGDNRSIRALGTQLGESTRAHRQGLFAYTSMFDLDILEREVSYPYDGPFLRLS